MNTSNFRNYVWVAGTAALLAVAFAAFATGVSDMKSWSHPNGQVASISVSGEGEVISVPDVATVSMTVREVSKTVPEAQKLVEAKIAKVLAALSASGVEKKDIKTLSYTINPRYEVSPVICTNFGCPQGKSTVTGYEVAQYVTIKVRDIEKSGEVIGLIGGENVTELSGPEFTVDDLDAAKEKAKANAILDAREKAKKTADALGVSLGSVISFGEDNGGYYPMLMSAKAVSFDSRAAPEVSLPTGESVIKSRVTVTYTLK